MSRRLVIAFASLLLVVVGVEVFLHREWLFGKPTDDGQQYIIQGGKIDPRLIPEGQADPIPMYTRVSVRNKDEAAKLLGYVPVVPKWVPDGWILATIDVVLAEDMNRYVVVYTTKDNNKLLKYEKRTYQNAQRAQAAIQQDVLGETIRVGNIDVYIKTNTQVPACVWIDGLSYSAVYGPVSENDLFDITRSILEEGL